MTMEASAHAFGDDAKAEFLKVATEWLRLADEIEKQLLGAGQRHSRAAQA